LTINGYRQDFEGVLYVESDISIGRSPFPVRYYSTAQSIPVRRVDHDAPYPPGFLGFIKKPYINSDASCEVDTVCIVKSGIVGNDPANITLWRKQTDGRKEQLTVTVDYNLFGGGLVAEFYIANISRSEAGRYIYRGSSHSGKIIEKEFQINVTVPYVILRNESEVVQDTPEVLVVRCVGKGYPDPEIKFYNGTDFWEGNDPLSHGSGVSIVHNMEDDEHVNSTLTIDREERPVTMVTCTLEGTALWNGFDRFEVYNNGRLRT